MATTLVSMGHRPPPQHDDGLLPRSSVARGLLDDKSEDARVALCALTLYDDAKVCGMRCVGSIRAGVA